MHLSLASFESLFLFFSAKGSIKSRKFLIDDREQLIRSCRNVESEMERLVSSARPDSLIASATQELGDRLIPELNLQSATANTEGSFAATKFDLQQ